MKTTKILAFGFIVLAILFTSNTFAQQSRLKKTNRLEFKNFDTNGDGIVTKAEFKQVRAQKRQQKAKQSGQMRNAKNAPDFAQFDRNGDGKISKREFKKQARKQARKQKRNRKKNKKKNKKQTKNKYKYQKDK